jgi:predicted AlkP superfamily phosphohydrolase/phosphomutase
MAPRLIVLGWDSATFDVVDPLLSAGRLPNLAGLIERGQRAPLRSTWPPMTDCAWTSAFTGRNPGAHGIFGSWYRAPGAYACRYFSSRDRRAPALWELTEGIRHLVWNVPMSFPPSRIEGAMVAGYGAPPGSRFCEPASLQEELARRWSLDDLLDRAPHGSLARFREDLIHGLKVQSEALIWATTETGADCVAAVWPHVDRAQHFFWQFRETNHELSGAIDDVHVAMDRATGAVVEAFPDADVVIVSDHGAGPLFGDVNVGTWLARNGYATYGDAHGSRLASAAWALPPSIRKFGRRVAPGIARKAMGAKLAGELAPFEWGSTKAFFGVHSDLWLNLEGREAAGIVRPSDADELVDELAEGLLALADLEGRPVFGGAHRRADVYSGSAVDLAPDLILDSWSAGFRVAPSRAETDDVVIPPAPLSGVNEPWSSDHRPVGIFAAAGPRIAAGTSAELSLYDVCPIALALLEQDVPEGLDGDPRPALLEPGFLAANPIRHASATFERSEEATYSEDEAAAVAAHLKELGYIE